MRRFKDPLMMARLMSLWLLAGAVAPIAAQETFRLVSAQVVSAGDRPPTLRLSASGPIAYRVLDDSGTVSSVPGEVRARLYGVTPGELGTLGTLAPFSVSVAGEGHDTILTVSAASLPPLTIKTGSRSNEIAVTVRE
jgi:hypothetical protein